MLRSPDKIATVLHIFLPNGLVSFQIFLFLFLVTNFAVCFVNLHWQIHLFDIEFGRIRLVRPEFLRNMVPFLSALFQLCKTSQLMTSVNLLGWNSNNSEYEISGAFGRGLQIFRPCTGLTGLKSDDQMILGPIVVNKLGPRAGKFMVRRPRTLTNRPCVYMGSLGLDLLFVQVWDQLLERSSLDRSHQSLVSAAGS